MVEDYEVEHMDLLEDYEVDLHVFTAKKKLLKSDTKHKTWFISNKGL